MGYQEHRENAPRNLNCAVLTISDSRTEATDESGKYIREKLTENGHRVMAHALLKNDANSIKNEMATLLQQADLQIIITSGGTGVSHRDVTVETISPILEKKLDGFGELFRSLSYQEIGTASMMSRAIAGVAGGKVILCLPGSLGATKLAMEKIILPEIGHMVREATR
ncbi:MAG: MogA/MoaB family molybdenum cofactor biosynthesis protein [Chloroflexota bacterium]